MFVSSPPVKNEIPILIHGNSIRQTTLYHHKKKFEYIYTTSNLYDATNHRNETSTLTDPLTYRNRSSSRSARSRRCHRSRRPQMDLKTPNQSLGRYKPCRVPTISPRLAPRGIAGKVYGEMRASCWYLGGVRRS